MKLSFFLKESRIFLNLEAASERELIEKALEAAPDDCFAGASRDTALKALLQREARGSTVMGEASFLPHARIEGIEQPFLLLATSREPVEVTASQRGTTQARMAFILLTPPTRNTFMLQTMAAVAKLLSNPEEERALLNIKSPARIVRHIEDLAVEIKKILIAADIMAEHPQALTPEMTLAQAVQNLVDHRVESMAVVNEGRQIIGELSSEQIFAIGVPKFLSLMTDTSQLVQFEAFSKFFESEHDMSVKDVMAKDFVCVRPETSVMSVAHQLMATRRHKAYVVDAGILTGEIDRRDILRKVFGA
jgi:mannitol/fructose-specific phosphotransferase system IIA component (Ntr-type)